MQWQQTAAAAAAAAAVATAARWVKQNKIQIWWTSTRIKHVSPLPQQPRGRQRISERSQNADDSNNVESDNGDDVVSLNIRFSSDRSGSLKATVDDMMSVCEGEPLCSRRWFYSNYIEFNAGCESL